MVVMNKKDLQSDLRKWITHRLKAHGHGSKTRLADHIGVNRDAITRMLKPPAAQGYRVIKASELASIAEFFGETPPGFNPDFANQGGKQKLIDLFEQASPQDQEAILSYVEFLISKEKKK